VADVSITDAATVAQELGRTGLVLRFKDAALEACYRAQMQAEARPHNRYTIPILILLVDVFFLPELWQAPEVIRLSAILRFAILTPLTALFVLLDWRGLFGRFYGVAVMAMGLFPTAFICIEIIRTTSAAALPNLQATPLIQIIIVTSRLTLLQAAIIMAGSSAFYIWGIAHSAVVPALFLPSMDLTSLSIGLGMWVFAMRVELRERKVFLLNLQAEGRNHALAHLVRTDALTGVANRRCFNETLESVWAEAAAGGMPVGLIMIDVDHFKKYNDHYGHQGGDDCLRQVAQVALALTRKGDMIARYGGEEFAVIVRSANLANAVVLAERLLAGVQALRLPHRGLSDTASVSVSMGVASMVPTGESSPQMLIEAADKSLYAAKRAGRNGVAAYEEA